MAGGAMAADDPLRAESGGLPKAMIQVAGRTLVQRVVDALSGASSVEGIVLVAADGVAAPVSDRPLHMVAAVGDEVDNLCAGVARLREVCGGCEQLLVVPADVPLLRSDQVDWFTAYVAAHPAAVHYGLCRKETVEAAFPDSDQLYVRLRGGTWCGADLHATRVDALLDHLDTWRALLVDRKHAWRQARTLGLTTLLLAAARLLTAQQVVARASHSLGLPLEIVELPWAEPAVDVDRPEQLQIVQGWLTAHAA